MFNRALRSRAFWTLDFIRGANIRNHLNELKNAFDDPVSFKKVNQHRLEAMLDHACTTTPFYKQFANFNSLNEFPVIDKKVLKEQGEDMFSTLFNRSDLVTRATSGSSGVPFTYYMTQEKYKKRLAEVLFFNNWAGYELGMKYAHIKPQTRSRWKQFYNNVLDINPTTIDEKWLAEQRKNLMDPKIKFLVCYPTPLLYIAEYCKNMGDSPDQFHLKGIVCSAEKLTPQVRKKANSVFGCMLLDRYSSQELGIIAHQNKNNENYSVNHVSHYFELLKFNTDEPVKPGEPGRVVVTDLFSYAMPLIRYEVGDSAELCKDFNSEIPQIQSIHGRIVDTVYSTSGKSINYSSLYQVVDQSFVLQSGILQFQFIQKGKNIYVVKLKVKPAFNHSELLINRYKELLGYDANIKLEYLDVIPQAQSGKRAIVINEYKNASLSSETELLPYINQAN